MRSATSRDVAGVVETVNARTQAFYGENQTTNHDVETWWSSPRFELEKGLRLVLDPCGSVPGLISVGNPGEPYARIECSAVVHQRAHEHDGQRTEEVPFQRFLHVPPPVARRTTE
ncbi:MAG: hypothetical protein PHU43_04625 [Candidatus Bipolaricaulis sp.]|nr:hypothetical protein [Candidatus Bipolaricaulis sp.]